MQFVLTVQKIHNGHEWLNACSSWVEKTLFTTEHKKVLFLIKIGHNLWFANSEHGGDNTFRKVHATNWIEHRKRVFFVSTLLEQQPPFAQKFLWLTWQPRSLALVSFIVCYQYTDLAVFVRALHYVGMFGFISLIRGRSTENYSDLRYASMFAILWT